jgi:hypothetical protein
MPSPTWLTHIGEPKLPAVRLGQPSPTNVHCSVLEMRAGMVSASYRTPLACHLYFVRVSPHGKDSYISVVARLEVPGVKIEGLRPMSTQASIEEVGGARKASIDDGQIPTKVPALRVHVSRHLEHQVAAKGARKRFAGVSHLEPEHRDKGVRRSRHGRAGHQKWCGRTQPDAE